MKNVLIKLDIPKPKVVALIIGIVKTVEKSSIPLTDEFSQPENKKVGSLVIYKNLIVFCGHYFSLYFLSPLRSSRIERVYYFILEDSFGRGTNIQTQKVIRYDLCRWSCL